MSTDKISITPDELVELEKLCDRSSLYDVLCALAVICHKKAEGLEQVQGFSDKWQPEADIWRKRGLQVQATAEYLERMENTTVQYSGQARPTFTGRLKR